MPWIASRNPKVQAKWRRLCAAAQSSGLTRKDFAAANAVSAISLSRWNRVFQQQGQDEVSCPVEPKQPALIEVLVDSEPVDDGGFVVDLRGGHRVHLTAQFDAFSLDRLVRVLERV